MTDVRAQAPLTLYEGDDRIGDYSSELDLFRAVEPPDVENYRVVDSRGDTFKISVLRPDSQWILDAVADALGAPVLMRLIKIL